MFICVKLNGYDDAKDMWINVNDIARVYEASDEYPDVCHITFRSGGGVAVDSDLDELMSDIRLALKETRMVCHSSD